jgi:hypothetical protein
MTFSSSGTANNVTSVLNGVTAAQVTAGIVPGGAVPSQMKPSASRAFWIDPGMLNNYNVIYTQANLVYRM